MTVFIFIHILQRMFMHMSILSFKFPLLVYAILVGHPIFVLAWLHHLCLLTQLPTWYFIYSTVSSMASKDLT